jgi:glycosyltransferase involved in cell wall biosynthesis
MPTSALVIATYNWPAALTICLESVRRQTVMPDEVIIADDGSGAETKNVVELYRKILAVPLRHVWQKDNGYQLARIRNKAFAAAQSAYIIQIDGDLILDPHFVEDHLSASRPDRFCSGSRTLLHEEATQRILESVDLYPALYKKDMSKRYNAIRNRGLSFAVRLFQRNKKNVHFVLGCNMAFWKKDLLKVNGYNEAFSGWGKEDNDIAARLINAGVELRFIKFGAVVYHLHHRLTERPMLQINEQLFQRSLSEKITYVPQGMDQYIA